jgi:hypothetical protein
MVLSFGFFFNGDCGDCLLRGLSTRVVIERRPRRSGRLRRRGIETEIESAWVSVRSIQSAAVLGGSNEPVVFDPWLRST